MRVLMLLALGVTVFGIGCGSSTRTPDTARCTTLGDGTLTPQVALEVVIFDLGPGLSSSLGLTYDQLQGADPLPFPSFGGQVFTGVDASIPSADIGGALIGDSVVPASHAAGSFLPRAWTGPTPGPGEISTWVQAPGADGACLEIDPRVQKPIDALATALRALPLVPFGSMNQDEGIAFTVVDEGTMQSILGQIDADMDSSRTPVAEAHVFDGQRCVFLQHAAALASVLDLNANAMASQNGIAFDSIAYGSTLEVVPRVLPGDRIAIDLWPTSQAILGNVAGTPTVGGVPVTIQVPIVQTSSVRTTIEVADGETVILGGLKRLDTGMQPGDVPLLSAIPYINRLFTNTSTAGREAFSIMLMVTPRIIIQEEEEN